jgi:hypothetical protein
MSSGRFSQPLVVVALSYFCAAHLLLLQCFTCGGLAINVFLANMDIWHGHLLCLVPNRYCAAQNAHLLVLQRSMHKMRQRQQPAL